MLLTEAREVDTSVDDNAVRAARDAAVAASAEAALLAQAAVTDTTVTGAVVAAARTDVEIAERRVEHVAVQADRAAQARRLLALADLGERVDQFAGEVEDATATAIATAVRVVADAVAGLRHALADYDATVLGLVGEATRLNAEALTHLLQARATSAGVATDQGRWVRHEQTQVQVLGEFVDRAVEHAVAGRVGAALELLQPVVHHQPLTGLRVLVGAAGAVLTYRGALPAGVADNLRRGEVVELQGDVLAGWVAGEVTDQQAAAYAMPLLERAKAAYRVERAASRRSRSPIVEPTFGA